MHRFNLTQFIDYIKSRRVICFGAGIQGQRFPSILHGWEFSGEFLGYIDNNKKDSKLDIRGVKYAVYNFDEACEIVDDSVTVVISSLYYKEIYSQILADTRSREWDCCAMDDVANEQLQISDYDGVIRESDTPLIPKIIHYAWVGGDMPDKIKRNIASWKKMCPDYEFREWNDKNYDVEKNNYMKQAYDNKVWGFVPDYMRLDVVYEQGGIYLDTDIEMVKRPDELLYQRCFGCIDASLVMNLGSGFGASPKCEIIKELRDYYDNVSFVKSDGSLDKTSCNTHSLQIMQKYGMISDDMLQNVAGMNVYPMIFQGACQYTREKKVDKKTFWIHYGNMSWMK